MKLDLSESQTLLQDSVARLFKEQSTMARVRQAEETGFDAALWKELVALGVTGMRIIAPDEGGSTLLDAAIVAEEAGRNLASVPVVETMVANGLLYRAGASEAIRAAIDAGAVTTLALQPVKPGAAQIIAGGSAAQFIAGYDGDALFVIALNDKLSKTENLAASSLALVDLSNPEIGTRTDLAKGDAALTLYQAAIEEWKLLTAASIAGLGNQALLMAAQYSVERVQFGKPIGTYQGVSHPLADSAVDVDGGKLLVWHAIASIAEDAANSGALVSMAYWWAGQAIQPAVQRAMRTFGGYGLSLEYDIQLYYRRGKMLALLMGNPQAELDRISARLWLDEQAALPQAGDVEISFDYGEEAKAYAAEVRAFVEANMTPEIEAKKHHSTSGFHAGFHKKMADAGYAFPDMALPGQTPRSRYAVMESVPMWEDMNWTRTPTGVSEFCANMSQLWSQPEAKEEILTRIISGDALGCLGFSEPASGSDVFAANFSADFDGKQWVMNGQKMFTTNAHNADYILMLTRTDNGGRKHEGLTMFLMPLNLPGVEIHPVYTLQDERTNIIYWTDVRIPDKYRLGEVGDGARVMSSALGFEHGGSSYQAAQQAMMKHAVNWARKPRADGSIAMEDVGARRVLANAATVNQIAILLCRREVWADVEEIKVPYYGAMSKMFGTETMAKTGAELVELAAPESLVRGQDHDLDMVEITARRAVGMTIYGGTSEVHRSVIAEKALGMPKSR